jgi:hypothetical protein
MKSTVGTVKVKIEPEIDLSNINEEILDALADKIADRLKSREQIVINPAFPQPYRWPLGQVWWC